MHLCKTIFVLVLAAAAPQPIQGAPWVDLFDGKRLGGWEQKGGKAKYRVEDGAIVGTTVPNTPNSFLCTQKHYGDFILEYEFKVHPELNSGVQIRSHVHNQETEYVFGAKGVKVAAGRVHGYQIEIDPSPKRKRWWSSGFYEEGRRKWLYPGLLGGDGAKFTEQGATAFKQNDWNKVRIEAIGDRITTTLNGHKRVDAVDAMTLSGFIGLQVHGVGKRTDPLEVRWRHLRIKDLGHRQWLPLFDGKSLDGWHALPGGKWEVQDGALIGSSPKSEKRHGLLVSDKNFDNFTVRVEYKLVRGNSGFYFRSEKVKHAHGVNGFQAEIDAAKDGGLYETGGRQWVVQPNPSDAKRWIKPGGWNQMTVSAHGTRIVVHVNNHLTAELPNDTQGRKAGHLALQLHGNQDMEIRFRKIEMLSAPAPNAP